MRLIDGPNIYVKYDEHNFEAVYIFVSGSGGTTRFHLGKVTYNSILKTLLYHCKSKEKARVHLLGPTEILVVNIGRTAIHFCLGINTDTKQVVLNEKSRAALKIRLSVVRLLIIGEFSLVSSNLWTDMDPRLRLIFVMVPGK